MKRIYIAGPVTGMPEHNRQAFKAAAQELNDIDYQACNPVALIERIEGEPTHQEAMRMCIGWLVDCDGVALLPGYLLSKGAQLERKVAQECGIECKPLREWLA